MKIRPEHISSPKGGEKSLAPKDSASEGSSAITLNAAALGSVIAEALKSSFEGPRDSMNAGFTGVGDLIASHTDDEPDDANDDGDLSRSKDDDELLIEGERPAKKSRPIWPTLPKIHWSSPLEFLAYKYN